MILSSVVVSSFFSLSFSFSVRFVIFVTRLSIFWTRLSSWFILRESICCVCSLESTLVCALESTLVCVLESTLVCVLESWLSSTVSACPTLAVSSLVGDTSVVVVGMVGDNVVEMGCITWFSTISGDSFTCIISSCFSFGSSTKSSTNSSFSVGSSTKSSTNSSFSVGSSTISWTDSSFSIGSSIKSSTNSSFLVGSSTKFFSKSKSFISLSNETFFSFSSIHSPGPHSSTFIFLAFCGVIYLILSGTCSPRASYPSGSKVSISAIISYKL